MKLKPLLVYLSENPKALKNIAQRKGKESQEEDVTEEPEIHNTGNGKGIFFT